MFCIHKNLIGSQKHLLYDKNIDWVSEIPKDTWIVENDGSSNNDLITALRLSGSEINTSPPKEQVRVLRSLCDISEVNVPWQMCMPKKAWDRWVQGIVENVSIVKDDTDTSYYKKYFLLERELLVNLDKIKPRKQKLKEYLINEEHQSVLFALKTFTPRLDGLCRRIVYKQEATTSGRLTVGHGPSLLTLRADLRDVIGSYYDGGKIYSLDYDALEPRLSLDVVGHEVPEKIYEVINQQIFDREPQTRGAIKLFVLACLYGSGAENLSKKLLELDSNTKMPADKCRQYLPLVKAYFGIKNKTKSLVFECENFDNKITNLYGKVIKVPDPKPYKIYNHYIQSSGVQCALLGFHKIYKTIKENNLQIRVIGVLHDALFLDCHPDYIKDLDALKKCAQKIPKIGTKMILKSELLA